MQTTLEETDKHTVKLTVEIPPDEVNKDLDRAYRKIAQQVKIPGFRKGKVPKQIIDAQIGRDVVRDPDHRVEHEGHLARHHADQSGGVAAEGHVRHLDPGERLEHRAGKMR